MDGKNEIDNVIMRLKLVKIELEAAYNALQTELRDCRNELCLRCGQYKTSHLGSCDGCRWRADNG